MENNQQIIDSEASANNNLKPLVVGQVDFINCFPINIPFAGHAKINNIKTNNAIPSKLNEMILNGDIDIAPISSYAYLQNKDKLTPIGDLCIASNGPADSVLLFSNKPIENLNGGKIALTHASATSNQLVQVILKKYYRYKCDYWVENKSLNELKDKYDAVLLIGDEALKESISENNDFEVYDLGKLWKNCTGLPMVFALWVIRNKKLEESQSDAIDISKALKRSLKTGLEKNLDKIIEAANNKLPMPEGFYKDYFEHLSYDFNDKCKKGLSVFEEHSFM